MPIKTTTSLLNIKSYGAVGDGVTSDQTAFNNALADVPTEGGTIFFPIGKYRLPDGAFIGRDNVKLLGESRKGSIIFNDTESQNGVQISVYRRGGWVTDIDEVVPYEDDLFVGQNHIKPQDSADLSKYSAGDKIFIAAGGSAQFDQEYGEFNIVKEVDNVNNLLILEKNLARDYRSDYATWSATVATNFTPPPVGDSVTIDVNVLVVEGVPGSLKGISIGNELYEVTSDNYNTAADNDPLPADEAGVYQWTVKNIGVNNATSGTISAGTKIFKQRVIIKTPNSYSGTVIENLTIDADGDVINLSNCLNTIIKDVDMYRQDISGGLWADMDDGRNAKFINCRIESALWDACQPARSFGELSFEDCEFHNAGIDWSEYCFSGSLINCKFYMQNPTDIQKTYCISLGWSTSNMRVEGCTIYGDNLGSLIDIEPDINGYKGAWRGGFTIKNNWLYGNNLEKFIRFNQTGTTDISGNHIFGNAEALFSINGHNIPVNEDGTRNATEFFINSSFVHVHHNYFAGSVDTLNLSRPSNLVMEDNWFHYHSRTPISSNFNNGSIMWNTSSGDYGNIEMLKIRNNTFKNWPFADGSLGGPGTPQPSFNFDPALDADNGETVRTDITNNLFLDSQDTYLDPISQYYQNSEFIMNIYPTP